MSFETTLPITLRFEGGYANSPKDAGGETFRGISRKANPSWPGWKIIDEIKAKGASGKEIDKQAANYPSLTVLVSDLYQKNYYQPVAQLGFSEPITDKLFDMYVNMSSKSCFKLLQKAVNSLLLLPKYKSLGQPLTVDGVMGPKTKELVNSLKTDDVLGALALAQKDFYLNGVVKTFPNARDSFVKRALWLPETA